MSDIRFNICGNCPPFYAQLYCSDKTTLLSSKSISHSGTTYCGSLNVFSCLKQNTSYYIKVTDSIGKIAWSCGGTTPITTPADYVPITIPDRNIYLCGEPSLDGITCKIDFNTTNKVVISPSLDSNRDECITFCICPTIIANNTEQGLTVFYKPNGQSPIQCIYMTAPTNINRAFTIYSGDEVYYEMFMRCINNPICSTGSIYLGINNITSSSNINPVVQKSNVGFDYSCIPVIPVTNTTICFCPDPTNTHKAIAGTSGYYSCGCIMSVNDSLLYGQSVDVSVNVHIVNAWAGNCSECGCTATSSCGSFEFMCSNASIPIPVSIGRIANQNLDKSTLGSINFNMKYGDIITYCAYTQVLPDGYTGEAVTDAVIGGAVGNNVTANIDPLKNTVTEITKNDDIKVSFYFPNADVFENCYIGGYYRHCWIKTAKLCTNPPLSSEQCFRLEIANSAYVASNNSINNLTRKICSSAGVTSSYGDFYCSTYLEAGEGGPDSCVKQRVEYGAQCYIINSSNINSFEFEISNLYYEEFGLNLTLTSCSVLASIDQFICGKYVIDTSQDEAYIYRNYP